MAARSEEHAAHRPDAGLTLIEVMVAVLVFGIIATGIVAAAGTIARMTGDNRARATASNLAAQDIDLVRAVADPFQVAANSSDIAVAGRTYSVKRTVSWVSSAGGDISCNSSTNLFYLRVNVRVTWSGMLTTTAPVQDDTILAPSGRISNSASGSIAVAVSGVDAGPESGVTVTIDPVSGGAKALTTQPKATGADGCTYANQVTPGTYKVTVSKSGWVDTAQSASPSKNVTVSAGTTQSAAFEYDQAGIYLTPYAPGPVAYSGTKLYLPTNLDTNFVSTSGTYTTTAPAGSVNLYPYPSGYSAFVGKASSGTTNCASVDPAAWTASGTLATGVRGSAAAASGEMKTLSVPVGVVRVKAPANNLIGITQAAPAGSGNPGCGITGTVYTYSVTTSGDWMTFMVPYGTWRIYYGTSVNNATPVTSAQVQILTNAVAGGVASDGTVTLDPRASK